MDACKQLQAELHVEYSIALLEREGVVDLAS